jgi:hypothetical protein
VRVQEPSMTAVCRPLKSFPRHRSAVPELIPASSTRGRHYM